MATEKGLFAERLDRLFRTVHPEERGPYTPDEVAATINEAAGENAISATYPWQLRTGRCGNPTYRHLIGIRCLPPLIIGEPEMPVGAPHSGQLPDRLRFLRVLCLK